LIPGSAAVNSPTSVTSATVRDHKRKRGILAIPDLPVSAQWGGYERTSHRASYQP
jgi:hypothetical protein